MATRRMVSGDIWRDDFVSSLTWFERLLWIGIIVTCADDQGRMQDRANRICSDVFPDDNAKPPLLDDALNKFVQAGKIIRYTVGNEKLIQIIHWWKYQSPAWAVPSKYNPPNNWTDRIKVHAPGNKVIMKNWEDSGGFSDGTYHSTYEVRKPIEDVKGDVKGDVNFDGEEEVEEEAEVEIESEKTPVITATTNKTGKKLYTERDACRIILKVSGLPAIPPDQLKYIESVMGMFDLYPEADIEDAMVLALSKWVKTDRVNGTGTYSRTNFSWITWAAAYLVGEKPWEKSKKKTEESSNPFTRLREKEKLKDGNT